MGNRDVVKGHGRSPFFAPYSLFITRVEKILSNFLDAEGAQAFAYKLGTWRLE
jgi:hypothetical protein